MTVTVDAATEHVRTDTTSPQTFSHGGAASGVKGVVLALVHGTSATDHVSAASYGGVAMSRLQRNTDTLTEPGAAELWFLGASVPQGTQTVSYTPGATTDDFHAVCITLLADADTEVIDQDGVSENVANPSVTLQYGGRSAMAFAALYGGGPSPADFAPNANCTTVHDHDLGAFYSEIIRQTTAGTSDFAIGGTSGTDDVAFAAIAVAEVQANWTLAVDAAAFDIDGQVVGGEAVSSLDPAELEIVGQSIGLTITTPLAVDAAAFSLVGQDIGLTATSNWTLAVDAAAIQPSGQAAVLDLGAVITAAAIQPAGQDITLTLTSGLTLPVDAAAFQIDGQAVAFDRALAVTQATAQADGQAEVLGLGFVVSQAEIAPAGQSVAFGTVLAVEVASVQIDGQDVSLVGAQSYLFDVTAAAFALAGSDIGLLVTGTQEQPSGGYVEYFRWEQREMARREKRERELREIEEEADRLEQHLIDTGSLPGPGPEIRRIEHLVWKYRTEANESLPNRARRAFDYAERVRTELAWKLAQKEYQRLLEEEEMALLMVLALD